MSDRYALVSSHFDGPVLRASALCLALDEVLGLTNKDGSSATRGGRSQEEREKGRSKRSDPGEVFYLRDEACGGGKWQKLSDWAR